MSREQQGIVLFLSLTLLFYFFLTSWPSLFRNPLPPAEEGTLTGKETQGKEFMVEMDGMVKERGVYPVPRGMRLPEVIAQAGGIKENLSLPPEILRREIDQNYRITVQAAGQGKGTILWEPLAPQKLPVLNIAININTANLEELKTLPGIGPQTAQAIIEYRERKGRFTSSADLLQVRGIGPKKLASLRNQITVQ